MPKSSMVEGSGTGAPVLPGKACPHELKYRFYYGKDGIAWSITITNVARGGHCHIGGREEPYHFTTVEQLVTDFLADVVRMRREDK